MGREEAPFFKMVTWARVTRKTWKEAIQILVIVPFPSRKPLRAICSALWDDVELPKSLDFKTTVSVSTIYPNTHILPP